jgi:hypothetical protein
LCVLGGRFHKFNKSLGENHKKLGGTQKSAFANERTFSQNFSANPLRQRFFQYCRELFREPTARFERRSETEAVGLVASLVSVGSLALGVGSIWRIVSRCPLQLLRVCCGRLAGEMWVVSGCLPRSLYPFEIYLKIENKEIYGACGSLYGIERK